MNQNLFLQRHMANFPRIHGSLTALSLVLRPFVFKDHSYDIFLCCYCLAFFQDVSYCPFDIGPNNVAFVVKINAGEGMLEVHKYSKYVMFIGIQSQLVTQIWFNIYPCVTSQWPNFNIADRERTNNWSNSLPAKRPWFKPLFWSFPKANRLNQVNNNPRESSELKNFGSVCTRT